jgi:hypothetical protein
MCCVLNEGHPQNDSIARQLYYKSTLKREDLLDLGLARWNFYFRFGDGFEFMVQRLIEK